MLWLVVVRSAVEYSSTDPTADHLEAGVDAASEGRLDDAIASFRSAAKYADSSEAWFNLGLALMDKAIEDETDTMLKEEGITCFKTALTKNPDNEEAREELTQLGVQLLCNDDHLKLRHNTMEDFMHCNDAAMYGACEDVAVPAAQHPDDTFHVRKECPVSCGLCGGNAPMKQVSYLHR